MLRNFCIIIAIFLLLPINLLTKEKSKIKIKKRVWVNITKNAGYSDKIINYGIYTNFNPYYRQKYWTFDKAELGKKIKSIPKYRVPLHRYNKSLEVERQPKIRLNHILQYYREIDRKMFRPTKKSGISENEKDPIDYGLSSQKGD
ncbi:hypothetical protein ACFL35_05335 [Candidatus Riflebacteria bacterium]